MTSRGRPCQVGQKNWKFSSAILLASLSALSAFGFFFAPLWSPLLIVLDIVVIYQLAVHYRAQSTAG